MSNRETERTIKFFLLDPLCDMRTRPNTALVVSAADEKRCREESDIEPGLVSWQDTIGGKTVLRLLEESKLKEVAKTRIVENARSKFNDLTTGNVTVLLETGRNHSRFLEKELPQIANSPYVKSINRVSSQTISEALERGEDKYAIHLRMLQVLRGECSARLLERPQSQKIITQVSLKEAEFLAFRKIVNEELSKAQLERVTVARRLGVLNHQIFSHKQQKELLGWFGKLPHISIPHYVEGLILARKTKESRRLFERVEKKLKFLKSKKVTNLSIELNQLKKNILSQPLSKEDREIVKKMDSHQLRKRLKSIQKNYHTFARNMEHYEELKIKK